MPADALAASSTGHGPAVVLVHGFTQTGASWSPIVDRLGGGYRVTTVDAPGHGGSSDVRTDLPSSGDLVVAAGGRATYVGYSMGARICLHAALAHPDDVARLVLVSATAGIDDAADRVTRRADDDALATAIEQDGVDAFLDRWLDHPLFASLSRERAGLPDRRQNTASGLASSVRSAGTGAQGSLWPRLGELQMPVLVVAGAFDTKFVALARRLHDAITGSELVIVADAGHTVHLERPDEFADVLADWLDRTAFG